MKLSLIILALALLFVAFCLLPASVVKAGALGAWWACVLWMANDVNVRMVRRRMLKKTHV